jgi:phosphatidylglycerophosphatase A
MMKFAGETERKPPSRRDPGGLRLLIASAFGLGLSSIAPGTCGALLGVAAHIAVVLLIPGSLHYPVLLLVFVATCAAHFALTPWAQRYWNELDPSHFVLDEVAGYLAVPLLIKSAELWQVVVWGFLLFRAFDIIKIPPARQIDQKMHGAVGILLDDLVSAVYAAVFLLLLTRVASWAGFERFLAVTPSMN